VEKFFLPNINKASFEAMMSLVERYPDHMYPMMGLHPCDVKEDFEQELDFVKEMQNRHRFYGVGEMGIDLHWDLSFVEQQKEAFRIQVALAKELDLPVIIHARKALDLVFDLLDELNSDGLRGIFHCFDGSLEQAQRALGFQGFYLGIGGVVTFKNSGLKDVISAIDLEHLVLETDAPYLAPSPFRGKRNESSYIPNIADKLSEIKSVSIKEVARITTENAMNVFRISS
ncbi:MAG: TatD family hydrolase, partial [Flavobacteriales bacterium]|nr:TatD family hydrolase [Flavobacteriales bacterium]